jgi:hypothetical protein
VRSLRPLDEAGLVPTDDNYDNSPFLHFSLYMNRRAARYDTRGYMKTITTKKRVSRCGDPLGSAGIAIKDGVAHYVGVATCGNGWLCPVCSAKIRARRAEEASAACLAAQKLGLSAIFRTMTIPHLMQDDLEPTLSMLAGCLRYVSSTRRIKQLRQQLGYVGSISAKEITFGTNGWHPHNHAIEFFRAEITPELYARYLVALRDEATKYYAKFGVKALDLKHGVRLDIVDFNKGDIGQYVAKLQEQGSSVGNELARSDMKKGKPGHWMPFDILTSYFASGDMVLLDLWQEYETATTGFNIIRFSAGLRDLLLPDVEEKTDEEIAAEEVGGEPVVTFASDYFFKLVRVHMLMPDMLSAVEVGGVDALVKLLIKKRLFDSSKLFVQGLPPA